MNEHEDYFRISKNGDVHTLSDRTPFKWKELVVWTSASFIFLIYFLGFGVGIFVAFLTLIGYTFYRFASWIYYSEVEIDEKSGNLSIHICCNTKTTTNTATAFVIRYSFLLA